MFITLSIRSSQSSLLLGHSFLRRFGDREESFLMIIFMRLAQCKDLLKQSLDFDLAGISIVFLLSISARSLNDFDFLLTSLLLCKTDPLKSGVSSGSPTESVTQFSQPSPIYIASIIFRENPSSRLVHYGDGVQSWQSLLPPSRESNLLIDGRKGACL